MIETFERPRLQGELPNHGEAGGRGNAFEIVRLDVAEPQLSSTICGPIHLEYMKIT
jgi:hypothetical protein